MSLFVPRINLEHFVIYIRCYTHIIFNTKTPSLQATRSAHLFTRGETQHFRTARVNPTNLFFFHPVPFGFVRSSRLLNVVIDFLDVT